MVTVAYTTVHIKKLKVVKKLSLELDETLKDFINKAIADRVKKLADDKIKDEYFVP